MAGLYTLTAPIQDRQFLALRLALENVQGNILSGHGRDHSVHMLVQFTASPSEVKLWIHSLAERVTSAHKQLAEAQAYRLYNTPGDVFMSFVLSARGYQYLVVTNQARTSARNASCSRV